MNFHNKTTFPERGKRLQLQRKAVKTSREKQLITREFLKERMLKDIEDMEHDLSDQRIAFAFQRISYLCESKREYQLLARTTQQQISGDFGEFHNELYKQRAQNSKQRHNHIHEQK